MSKSNSRFNLSQITGWEEGFIPAPRSGFIQTCSKKKSGDKSLFPTCDFFIFGELTNFFLTKAQPQMAKLQNSKLELFYAS